jgi:CubicO group peptidase (beta-lactamase class C family)
LRATFHDFAEIGKTIVMLRFVLLTLLALIVWAVVFLGGTIAGLWRQPFAPPGDTRVFLDAAIARIEQEHKGNAAFALIERGRGVGGHFVSIGKPVDENTRFQVASLSKWITAWGVMTLVEAGKLDLDAPVSRYLTRWKLPPGKFDNQSVTVRRLLSHTAGLTDGLGYAGFEPGKPLQSLEESLTRTADASPGASGIVQVGIEPGSAFEYSGGGYTLLQLLIEEVSGRSFNDYMKAAVFEPLGMSGSTFVLEPDAANVAEFYDPKGAPATHYRFTGLAAASLYTTTADLTRFLAAHVPAPDGAPAGRGILRPDTLKHMRKPHASQFGAEIWGLGTMLYAPNNAGDFIIGHDGSNAPAVNTAARVDPATGDGIVVLESGNRLLATTIAGEWIFWRTGNVDFLTIFAESAATLKTLAAGGGAILVAALLIAWLARRRTRPSH